jgi:hypothetical protein
LEVQILQGMLPTLVEDLVLVFLIIIHPLNTFFFLRVVPVEDHLVLVLLLLQVVMVEMLLLVLEVVVAEEHLTVMVVLVVVEEMGLL